MHLNFCYRLIFLSILFNAVAAIAFGRRFKIRWAKGFSLAPHKRDITENPEAGPQNIVIPFELQARADLASSTCKCLEAPETVSYAITTLLPYMAAPYKECDIRAVTSNLCPIDYVCACRTNNASICIPTSIRTGTECLPTLSDQILQKREELPDVTEWEAQTIPTDLAEPSGQCGGTIQPEATECEDYSHFTLCNCEACACQSADYSQCVDTIGTAYRGTECPNSCATVRQEFTVSLPPPSATAKLGGQCGGRCWTGPTNCPVGATCFTERSPEPGAYAACDTANPGNQLKIRNNKYEGLIVPVKARAIATRIYF
ncbi:hypothetical protein TWF703_009297 [Orbilia oligospora]|uniref:CBM1 domain-containing protein n=1 Tax=Orbilia oligospora TaxID=2813651 RepID=A0A7C8JRV5_ORBOL|nr:hypothetical protein TWF703_009297 [Orbilia oligospora]